MKSFKFGLMLLVGVLTFISCKKDEPEVIVDPEPVDMLSVDVLPYYGSNALFLDTVYTTSEGYKVTFTDIKFYLENIRNGSNVLIDAGLFDYRERGTRLCSVAGDFADFANIDANIGVDAAINHNDPAAFSNDSWLNISNSNDMHWSWNPGYIFVKVEAKADTIVDATELLDHNVVFHVGLDANLKTVSFSNVQWMTVGNHEKNLTLSLDMEEFLLGTITGDPIDLKTEYTTHSSAGQEVLTTNVANNFQSALSLN